MKPHVRLQRSHCRTTLVGVESEGFPKGVKELRTANARPRVLYGGSGVNRRWTTVEEYGGGRQTEAGADSRLLTQGGMAMAVVGYPKL